MNRLFRHYVHVQSRSESWLCEIMTTTPALRSGPPVPVTCPQPPPIAMFLAGRQLLAARAGPANPISFVAGVSTAVSAFTNRRYSSSSSSKPSNPADGTRVLAQASPSNSARRRNFSGRRTAARQSFANPRGANLSKNSAVAPPQLPFVRSTEHMKPVGTLSPLGEARGGSG